MEYKRYPIDETIWSEIVSNDPAATFFHTPTWTKILCQTFPSWKNETFAVEFEDETIAIIPMMRRPILGIESSSWHESTGLGSYGGPIFKNGCLRNFEVLEDQISKSNNLIIVGNPFMDWNLNDKFLKRETFTQILKLNGDFSKIWRGFAKSRREAIRFAMKSGVIVKELNFLDYYNTYYDIYLDQIKRWGKKASAAYPKSLFYNIARASENNPHIKFWSAWQNETMIGGLIVFYQNGHVTLAFEATLTAKLKFRSEDYVFSTVIEHSCSEGLYDVDFGKSGGNKGVEEYKRHFGAIKYPVTQYQRRNILGVIYRAGRLIKNHLGICSED